MRALLREALSRDIGVTVPVTVLAETLRGGPRDAPVDRVLRAVGSTPTRPSTGRRAGALLGRTGGHTTADALVAAEAAAVPGSTVLTADPDDLGALLAGSPVTVPAI